MGERLPYLGGVGSHQLLGTATFQTFSRQIRPRPMPSASPVGMNVSPVGGIRCRVVWTSML